MDFDDLFETSGLENIWFLHNQYYANGGDDHSGGGLCGCGGKCREVGSH